jgi:hypothetical protein
LTVGNLKKINKQAKNRKNLISFINSLFLRHLTKG